MKMNESKRCTCGTVEVEGMSGDIDVDGCPNIHCEYNMCDRCPYCNETGGLIGDAEVLFECKNKHIWSYHDGSSLCYGKPGEFIGWILHEDYNDSSGFDGDSIEYYEEHKRFIRQLPKDIAYEDCSMFIWKCLVCGEKYMNIMCG